VNVIVINVINVVFEILTFLILVDVIGSWLLVARLRLPNWAYDIMTAVHTIVSPILDPIRRLMPNMGGLDLSPLIALFLLSILQRLVAGLLGR
jgi:YggT family protein